MRQVFSSQRLENTEAVAQLLRDAGIEVRITNGRSYKGRRRSHFRYTDPDPPRSAVWVVRADEQTRARAMLREAGLIDSTRGDDAKSFRLPTFHSRDVGGGADKRSSRIKIMLLAGIVIVVLMMFLGRSGDQAPTPPTATVPAPAAPAPAPAPAATAATAKLASPPFDGSVAPTLHGVARAVLASEIAIAGLPVVCLSVDGRDAPPALLESLQTPQRTVAPWSACTRDDQRGSFHRGSGQAAMLMEVGVFIPSAPDAGTVQYSGSHQASWADRKTLEVRRIDGQWQVTRTLKHVSMQG